MPEKKTYVEQKKSELNDWKHELDELKRRAKDTTGELKAKLDNQMVELQRLREEGGRQLKHAVEASEEAWDNVREDVEHTWKAFQHSVNYFRSHFKEGDKAGKK